MKKLKTSDFETMFASKLSEATQKLIRQSDLRFRRADMYQREEEFAELVRLIQSDLRVSGPSRKDDWEKGWEENLVAFEKTGNPNDLLPKYIRVNDLMRVDGSFIQGVQPNLETRMVSILRHHYFEKYFSGLDNVYEFGSGNGLNLVHLNEILPDVKLYGLDWSEASNKITEILGFGSITFDMFSPDNYFNLRPSSGVLTVGSMEQLGKDFHPFMYYITRQKPEIVVNIEPINELYGNTLMDRLGRLYHDKRGYLSGFLMYLNAMEDAGLVKIFESHRTFGSFRHDGYSVVVWRPGKY